MGLLLLPEWSVCRPFGHIPLPPGKKLNMMVACACSVNVQHVEIIDSLSLLTRLMCVRPKMQSRMSWFTNILSLMGRTLWCQCVQTVVLRYS